MILVVAMMQCKNLSLRLLRKIMLLRIFEPYDSFIVERFKCMTHADTVNISKFCSLLIVFFMYGAAQATSACIIMHGTWAKSEKWYQSSGIFFKEIKRCNQELGLVDHVLSFSWSGALDMQAWYEAAQELVQVIEQYDWVILIGHSHGATVGIVASQQLAHHAKNHQKIQKFYALAVPVDVDGLVYPDMQIVKHFYNLFSFGDFIQTVNGAAHRAFMAHERLANLAITINNVHPSHGGLHEGIIAQNILKIPEFLSMRGLNGFDQFCHAAPGSIDFFDNALPCYRVQPEQQALLELDKKVVWMMTMALLRHKKEK
jgi:hypothetical protein